MYWNLIVIALCFLLLVFLIWKEINRANKSWLIARIAVSAFAVISLGLIALPVETKQQDKTGKASALLILTEGFNNDTVQNILNIHSNARIFTTDKAITAFNATYITDAAEFADTSTDIKAVHIFGYGLDVNDLELLHYNPVIFHPAVIENSITAIGWTQKLMPGEPMLVQGKYNNSTSSPVKIVLNGLNTDLDSAVIAAKQTSYFRLTATPKHIDKAVYSIIVLSGKDTLGKEPLPVEVQPAQTLSILLLAASPDFENKFLKNWLAKNEYKFAVRTAISKNKYDKAYINITPISLDRLTPSLIEQFDVIIADASVLSSLTASDIASIANAVENKGTGFVVKADSAGTTSAFYSNSFPLVETGDSIKHSVRLHLNNTSDSMFPLKIEQPLYIRNIAGTQPLIKDQRMRTMVNSKIHGTGKIVLTTVANSFTWHLAGNTKDYTAYWSYILGKAAKKIPLQELWTVTPALPQRNEAVHLKLQTEQAGITQAQTGEALVYMEQNAHLPYEWSATYWPAKTGWQPAICSQGTTCWWYVFNEKNWQTIKAIHKISGTKKYISDHLYKQTTSSITGERPSGFQRVYFFIIFICCTGFLWFEKNSTTAKMLTKNNTLLMVIIQSPTRKKF